MNTILRKIGAGYHQLNDDFLIKKVLENVKTVDITSSDKLFIFSHRKSPDYLKLYTLIAHSLSKKGYPSCFLFRDCIINRYIPKIENLTKKIDLANLLTINILEVGSYFPKLIINEKEISNSLIEENSKIIITDKTTKELKYNWQINFEKELVKTKDVNFFPIIQTTLRSILKVYNIDFKEKKVINFSNQMINSMDLLLHYVILLKKYAKDNKKQIKIIGWEYNYIPNGFFRLVCDELSDNRDIEYIELSRGYKHYFGCPSTHNYFTTVNFTRVEFENKNSISKEKVMDIIENVDHNDLFEFIDNKFGKKNTTYNFNNTQMSIINRCNKFLRNDKHVFVLFAHLFYDNPIYDSSAAFHDMCDWINYSIEIFNSNDNLLLLKPHPKELRSNPDTIPNETLESFITENYNSLPDNIILLKPKDFKLYELLSFISCGLIWKSSAANELIYLGKPCIISGPSPFRYALDDLYYTQNKNHYISLIENVDKLEVTETQKLKIAAYIYGLNIKDIEIKEMNYSREFRTTWLNDIEIKQYLKNGDSSINKIIQHMVK